MNMNRKMIALILLAVFLVTAASCAKNSRTDAETNTDTNTAETNAPGEIDRQKSLENPIVITDRSGARLGEIDNRAGVTAVDDGIFYSVFTLRQNAYTGTAEYRFFRLKDNTDVFLGELEDQGYEAGFARTQLNGIVYTLAVRGNPAGDAAVPLLLLAFDTANQTMKTYTVSEYGFPYAAMTAANGKLLIMNHETTAAKEDKLYEFDPGTEEIKEVLSFSSAADSLRSVCAADKGFYLLRLKLNNGGENEMYVDRYDEEYVKSSELPINDMLVGAIAGVHGIRSRQDALNEIGMNVSRFVLIDGRYMVYENFGLVRLAIDLQTGETVIAQDDNYAVSTGNGVPVIYRIGFDAESAAQPEIDCIVNGKPEELSFTPDDAHRLIQTVSVSGGGVWAVLTADAFPVQAGTGVICVWSEP